MIFCFSSLHNLLYSLQRNFVHTAGMIIPSACILPLEWSSEVDLLKIGPMLSYTIICFAILR